MACHQTGDKPLIDSVAGQFTDAWLSLNVLNRLLLFGLIEVLTKYYFYERISSEVCDVSCPLRGRLSMETSVFCGTADGGLLLINL